METLVTEPIIPEPIPSEYKHDISKMINWVTHQPNVFAYYRNSSECSCCTYESIYIYVEDNASEYNFNVYQYNNIPYNCKGGCSKWINKGPTLMDKITEINDLKTYFFDIIEYKNEHGQFDYDISFNKDRTEFVLMNETSEALFIKIIKQFEQNKIDDMKTIQNMRRETIDNIHRYFLKMDTNNKQLGYYGIAAKDRSRRNIAIYYNKKLFIGNDTDHIHYDPYKIFKITYDRFSPYTKFTIHMSRYHSSSNIYDIVTSFYNSDELEYTHEDKKYYRLLDKKCLNDSVNLY
jgi:hypothetical protein